MLVEMILEHMVIFKKFQLPKETIIEHVVY